MAKKKTKKASAYFRTQSCDHYMGCCSNWGVVGKFCGCACHFSFKLGDKVGKIDGLLYVGIIVSVYWDLYDIEHADVQVPGKKGKEKYAGMIHLYPSRMLRRIK